MYIEAGRALLGKNIVETSLQIADGEISELGSHRGDGWFGINARGLLVLPGIIDLHGNAFERQMMPRPRVDFPIDVALIDSDRQAVDNGITTVFQAATWSWEPGLRSGDNARRLMLAIEGLRPQLAADTRFHLRQETFNLDAEDEIRQWLSHGRVDLLAFSDQTDAMVADADQPEKRASIIARCGLANDEFARLFEGVVARADEVPGLIARLTKTARTAHVRMLSRNDENPTTRSAFRAHGVTIAEFPIDEDTAREAAEGGDFIVFGAPAVVRAGGRPGWTTVADMIAEGLCSVLASDGYFPAQLLAAFRLAADGVLPLHRAWDLISAAPAQAAGLIDRGALAEGHRADIILVDDEVPLRPRIVAVIAGGRLVHLTDPTRLIRTPAAPRKAVAMA